MFCEKGKDSLFFRDRWYGTFGIQQTDIIVLLFPVHAFDSPEPVYNWIKTLPHCNGLPVAVISISAAGEYWINGACRSGSINSLTLKGYNVFYERISIYYLPIIGYDFNVSIVQK